MDLDDLKGQAQGGVNEIANRRVHGTPGEVPLGRLPHEGLPALLGPRFETRVKVKRYARRDCLVGAAGNCYAMPAAWRQKMRRVKETEACHLNILNGLGEVVAQDPKRRGRHKRVMVAAHAAGLWVWAHPASNRLVSRWVPQVEGRPLRGYA